MCYTYMACSIYNDMIFHLMKVECSLCRCELQLWEFGSVNNIVFEYSGRISCCYWLWWWGEEEDEVVMGGV